MQIISSAVQMHIIGYSIANRTRYIREEYIGDLKYGNGFCVFFFRKLFIYALWKTSRILSFDQVSELDR